MIFKSEDHKEGYFRLKGDYEAFRDAVDGKEGDISRLLENTFDIFVDRCWDEILGCLDDDWFDSVAEEIDNAEMAGSLEAIFEVVERHEGEVK